MWVRARDGEFRLFEWNRHDPHHKDFVDVTLLSKRLDTSSWQFFQGWNEVDKDKIAKALGVPPGHNDRRKIGGLLVKIEYRVRTFNSERLSRERRGRDAAVREMELAKPNESGRKRRRSQVKEEDAASDVDEDDETFKIQQSPKRRRLAEAKNEKAEVAKMKKVWNVLRFD